MDIKRRNKTMEQKQLNWNWSLRFIDFNQQWEATFDANIYPSIFNRETQSFKDYKTAFLWFETKLAEFTRGIDDFTRKLKDQNLMLMKQITEGRSL
jgi:hypothetical protein